MFRLSRRADHATRLLLELAVAEGGQLTAEEAARRSGVPLPYFRKSLAGLVSAGLVVTHPGPGGGLTLARPAAEITMLDVIEALEGAICLNACLLRPAECPRDRICPAHSFWGRLQLLVIAELRAATLEALAKEYPALRLQPRPKGQVHLSLQAAVSPQRSPIPAWVHPAS